MTARAATKPTSPWALRTLRKAGIPILTNTISNCEVKRRGNCSGRDSPAGSAAINKIVPIRAASSAIRRKARARG